jgi:hypothetical protein
MSEVKLKLSQSLSVAATTSSQLSSIHITGQIPASPYDAFTGHRVKPLETVGYEVGMFFETVDIVLNHPELLKDRIFTNALVEDAVLHARSLCSIFVGPKQYRNDFELTNLLPDFKTERGKYRVIRQLKKELDRVYNKGNPRYRNLFNEFVMHPTNLRGSFGLYEKPLRDLEPILRKFVRELESFTGPFSPIQ